MPRIIDEPRKGFNYTENKITGVKTSMSYPSYIDHYEYRPDMQKHKPRGLLLPKVYRYVQSVTETGAEVEWDYVNGSTPSTTFTKTCQSPISTWTVSSTPGFNPALLDRSVTQALIALKDQKVNFGQAIGEAKQTINLVGSLFSRAYQGYKKLRKGDPRGAVKAFSVRDKAEVPDRWLEFQYGLKPLIQDCDGALQHLAQQPLGNYRSIVRGDSHRQVETFTRVTNRGFPGTYSTVTEVEDCKVILAYLPFSPTAIGNVQAGANPAVLAWELTPFSFILDWALPVGDYLQTFDAAWGWEFLYGCRSQFLKQQAKVTHADYKSGSVLYRVRSSTSGYHENVSFTRSLYSGSPLPTLPRWKNPLSLGHVANGLSLLSSLLSSGTRIR